MKTQGAQAGRVRQTRAQRRAQERAQNRERQKQQESSSIFSPMLIGGALTVLVVLAIFVYALLRGLNAAHPNAALTTPADYNPGSALIAAGQKAPDFTLKTVNGTPYHLAAQRGHPVLLEFFAVWCPVCHAEAPTMTRLTKTYVPRGVRVWSILANPYGPAYDISGRTDLTPAKAGDLSWYAQAYNVHHPQLVDPTFATVNRYGVNAYPGLYVINKHGVIVASYSGHRGYATLAKALDKAAKS